MSSGKYMPGSVAKLLAAETVAPSDGKETKLQALFSKPPVYSVQSSGSKVQTAAETFST